VFGPEGGQVAVRDDPHRPLDSMFPLREQCHVDGREHLDLPFHSDSAAS